MAHEIGHAVQDRQGILYPDKDGQNEEQKQAYSRQIEVHADSVGIELLLKAGYPPEVFVMRREERFTCTAIAKKDTGDTAWSGWAARRYREPTPALAL